MKRKLFFIVIAVLAFSAAAVVSSAQKDKNPLNRLKDNPQFSKCGINKLDDAEIEGLLQLCSPRTGHNYLDESAVRFMENNGWRQINLIGAYNPESTILDEKFLIIIDNYDLVILDPWGNLDQLPQPGFYWAKNSLSSWDLVFSDGKIYNFKATDLE